MRENFIGKKVEIIQSQNQTLIGLKGTIIDETKNTFKIKTNKGEKTIMKNVSTFNIEKTIVEGNKIQRKSYERIKRCQ